MKNRMNTWSHIPINAEPTHEEQTAVHHPAESDAHGGGGCGRAAGRSAGGHYGLTGNG